MKLEPRASLEALAPRLADAAAQEDFRFTCKDGVLTSADVGRASGVSAKAAKRAIESYCAANKDARGHAGKGATLTLDAPKCPAPCTQTRAQMARIVAERIGVGRFALKKKIAERAARPPVKPKEKRVSSTQHPWTLGRHGRHVTSKQGGGVVATLTCSRCPTTEVIEFRQLADPDAMDRKFAQKGWSLDPARCPTHNRRNHQPRTKETAMATAPAATAPSPAAIAAQAKMFSLLQNHFDADEGVYGCGYSDARIAEECRLSVELVAGVRAQAFGALRVPSEVAQLQADITALESLLAETVAPIQSELRSLKQRVAECCKKFGG